MLDNRKQNIIYTCSHCGFKARVRKPAKCPKCSKNKFNKTRRIVTK